MPTTSSERTLICGSVIGEIHDDRIPCVPGSTEEGDIDLSDLTRFTSSSTTPLRRVTTLLRSAFMERLVVLRCALMAAVSLVLLAAFVFFVSPTVTGDGHEYFEVLQAWYDHATPDVRPNDIMSFRAILSSNEISNNSPYAGFFQARTGAFFGGHFWFYSLTATPVKFFLHTFRVNELAALQVTNIVFFCVAFYAMLFRGKLKSEQRAIFIALSLVGPVFWYLRWPGPEVYTWSLIVISLLLASERRYGLAATSASLGAFQNPGVILLALYPVVASLSDFASTLYPVIASLKGFTGRLITAKEILSVLRRSLGRRATSVLVAVLGLSIGLLPYVFAWAFYGHPSVLTAYKVADFRLISFGRTWSFLTDLNEGILPYAPLMLVLLIVAVWRMVATRDVFAFLLLCIAFGMILSCETITNWNPGGSRILRYAEWVLPLFAWIIAQSIPRAMVMRVIVVCALATQGYILLSPPGENDYWAQLTELPAASFALNHLPGFYNPEPEIFAERQEGLELANYEDRLPIPFIREDGVVTKILMDRQSLRKLREDFDVDGDYLSQIETKYASREGLFYLDPPSGKVKVPIVPAESYLGSIKLASYTSPGTTNKSTLAVSVDVQKTDKTQYSNAWNGSNRKLRLSYHIMKDNKIIASDVADQQLPYTPFPGESVKVPVNITLPDAVGRYAIRVFPKIIGIASSQDGIDIPLTVSNASASDYHADITRDPSSPMSDLSYRVEWISSQMPASVPVGSTLTGSVVLKNAGDIVWLAKPTQAQSAVYISYHWRINGALRDHYDGVRTELPHDLGPRQQAIVDNVHVAAPAQAGVYDLEITLVQENVTWFEQKGSDILSLRVSVT